MIICAVNRKGGVGKTQFCFQVSSALAATNRKVLCLDLDPQASLSQIWFGSKAVESMPKSRTIAAVFDPEYDPLPEHIVHLTTILNISVIPSSNDLTEHNLPLSHHPDGVTPLTPFLREIKNEYDVAIIDCPPNLQFCSFSALLVSDFVVVVVPPEDTSAQGLIYVRAAIKEAMNCGNSSLSLLGYLLTIYNRPTQCAQGL